MASKSLPEQLKTALQFHLEQSDVRHDSELIELFDKLNSLSDKVAAAKSKALKMREQKNT